MPAKYQVDSVSVGKILESPTERFVVPPFQRPFSWSGDQIAQLVEDVFTGTGSDDEIPYFLGSIVLANAPAEERHSIVECMVLDGQQRLTTLSLLVLALCDALISAGDTKAHSWRDRYTLCGGMGSEEYPKLQLQPDDAKIYGALLANADLSPQVARSTTLGKAYRKVQELVREIIGEEAVDTELRQLLQRLLEDVELVRITAPTEKDAFRLFETLNDRGLALNAADLIKNKLFAQCAHDIDDVIDAWAETLRLLRNDDIVEFLRVYWIATHGFVRKSKLYDVYKDHLEKLDPTAAALLALDIKDAAAIYSQMLHPEAANDLTALQKEKLTALNNYRAKVYRPTALAAFLSDSPQTIDSVLSISESITVRHTLIGERSSNSLEPMYADLAAKIRADKSIANVPVEWFSQIPKDDELKQGVSSVLLTNVTSSWRQFLTTLSDQYSSGETSVRDSSSVHVEHILPRNPLAKVLKEMGINQEQSAELCNRVGNLTLISGKWNQQASNKPFEDKKRDFYGKSDIAMTRDLAKYENWGAEEIENRSAELAAKAVVAFPHPSFTWI